jgi:tetratricopeptide (TPR) repeat protein
VAPLLLFVSAEAGLRLAGAALQARHRARTASLSGDGDLRIWALGDSYTYGIGADDPARDAWPMVVARLLEEHTGRRAQVRNLSTPGANSTEIVDRLEAAVQSEPAPHLVLLLAGVNNTRWLGQSGQFCLDEGAGGAANVAGALAGELGALRSYSVLRHLVLALRPPRDADRACSLVSVGFQHLDDGYPDRADATFEQAARLNPLSGWAALGLGLADLRVARHAEALVHLARAEELGVSPPAMALARGFSHRAASALTEARLVAEQSHHGDLRPFARILGGWLLLDRGDTSAAIDMFESVIAEGDREGAPGGTMPWALDGLGWATLADGRNETASAAFERSIAVGSELDMTPHLMGWSHVGRAVLRAESGATSEALTDLQTAGRDSAAVATAEAYSGWLLAIQSSAEDARAALARSAAVTPGLPLAEALARALEGLPETATINGPPPRPRPMPTIAVQQWLDPGDTRLVEADLRRAGQIAETVGARLVLTTYPQPRAHPELARAARSVASDASLLFVDPRSTFQEEHDRLGSWVPLLIADGHPTTRGYQLWGQVVSDALDGQPSR